MPNTMILQIRKWKVTRNDDITEMNMWVNIHFCYMDVDLMRNAVILQESTSTKIDYITVILQMQESIWQQFDYITEKSAKYVSVYALLLYKRRWMTNTRYCDFTNKRNGGKNVIILLRKSQISEILCTFVIWT